MKRVIHITADVPGAADEVTPADVADYVRDAVESFGGSLEPPWEDRPGDPFFPGNPGVKVREIRIGSEKFVFDDG